MVRSLLLLAAVLLAACSSPEPVGKQLARSAGCFSCHRVGSYGGDSAPDLTFVGFRRNPLWLEKWLNSPRGWKHDAKMPDFHLTEESRAILVEWLASLKGQDLPSTARKWSDGLTVFNKAGCVACHGVKGRGGEPNNNVPGNEIVALSKVVPTYTKGELIARIANGLAPTKADPKGDDPLVTMPAWKEVLTEQEIIAVADYLQSVGEASEEWK